MVMRTEMPAMWVIEHDFNNSVHTVSWNGRDMAGYHTPEQAFEHVLSRITMRENVEWLVACARSAAKHDKESV